MKLAIDGVEDSIARENFQKLDLEFRLKSLLNGNWKFIEKRFDVSTQTVTFPHGLTFTPQDIIQLSAIGNQNFYWIYNDFDQTNLSVYIAGPVILRFLVGKAA